MQGIGVAGIILKVILMAQDQKKWGALNYGI